uniref:(northern house mosquito) hypothetical protein n=1 Tax=Culex pipiens TaxID=7175 RepID=A0A8D8CES8_CULPI
MSKRFVFLSVMQKAQINPRKVIFWLAITLIFHIILNFRMDLRPHTHTCTRSLAGSAHSVKSKYLICHCLLRPLCFHFFLSCWALLHAMSFSVLSTLRHLVCLFE